MQVLAAPPRTVSVCLARAVAAGIVCLWAAAPVAASDLEVRVSAGGAPLHDVVIAVHGEAHSPVTGRQHVIDQVDKRFVPHVAAIRVGDRVSFPNSDDIRHHVYSFSPAKSFELPLYHGIPSEPVTFERPGKVVLGCNIHDGMSAYVYVLTAEHYALAADGTAHFADLAPGRYEIALWHPRQARASEDVRHPVTLGDADASLAFELALESRPAAIAAKLSPLEAKFRALRERAAVDDGR
jgi:plastocyanin